MIVFDNRIKMVESLVHAGAWVAEIGVLRGDFAEVLWGRLPEKLHLVDIWDGPTKSGDENGLNVRVYDGNDNYAEVMRKFGTRRRASVHRAHSIAWLNLQQSKSLDFVYLDTTHDAIATLPELRAAWRCIAPGGYLAGHDFAANDCVPNGGCGRAVHDAVAWFLAENPKAILDGLAMDGCVSFAIRKC